MRKRLLVSVAAVALLLGALAMVVYYKEGSQNLLLRRSVKVANATGWSLDHGNYGSFQIVKSPGAKPPDVYFVKNIGPPRHWSRTEFWLRKGFDGPETRLNAIYLLVHSTGALFDLTKVSDDCKRLLWVSPNGQGHIADMDGSHHVHWFVKKSAPARGLRSSGGDMVQWAPNHQILEMQRLDNTTYPLVLWRDARTLKETGRVVLSKTSDLNTMRPYIDDPHVDSKRILIAYELNTQVNPLRADRLSMYACRFDLNKNGKMLEKTLIPGLKVALPSESVMSVMVVHNGDGRILWLYWTTGVSPVAVRIHRYIHAFPADPQTTMSVYESRSDGSGMQELGHVPIHGTDPMSEFCVAWAADGHSAYFVYENALYRLPVD